MTMIAAAKHQISMLTTALNGISNSGVHELLAEVKCKRSRACWKRNTERGVLSVIKMKATALYTFAR